MLRWAFTTELFLRAKHLKSEMPPKGSLPGAPHQHSEFVLEFQLGISNLHFLRTFYKALNVLKSSEMTILELFPPYTEAGYLKL